MPRRPLRLSILLLFALLFFGGPSLVTFYTDWLWFNEAGYRQVFTAMLTAQTTLFTIVFATAALWLSVNLRLALAAVGDFRPVFTTREGLAITLMRPRSASLTRYLDTTRRSTSSHFLFWSSCADSRWRSSSSRRSAQARSIWRREALRPGFPPCFR